MTNKEIFSQPPVLTLEEIHGNKDIAREWIDNRCYYNPFGVALAQRDADFTDMIKQFVEYLQGNVEEAFGVKYINYRVLQALQKAGEK